MAITYQQIVNDIKNKLFKPVYFLMGDEPFFIDSISDRIAKGVLDEAEKEFNQTVLYGRDVDVGMILENAKRFPMMSNHQVVIVKEAQNVRSIEKLAPYVNNPLKSTILVICYKFKKIDKRKKEGKELAIAINANGVMFESKPLYENKIPEWINGQLRTKGYEIEPKACALLTEFLGNDLGKISNELGKLMLNLTEGSQITSEVIEQNIGISKDFNNFELQSALGKRHVLKANQIVNYFGKNSKSHPFVVTIAALYSFFSKVLMLHFLKDRSQNNVASVLRVNPYFVSDYQVAAGNYPIPKVVGVISDLRDYDLKSKGVGNVSATEGELLKELAFKILH